MIQRLATLSQGQPKPLWQVAIQAQETDFIRFLSDDRILVGTVETAGLAWGLEPKEVTLLNAANGETVWASLRRSFGFPQQLLATQPVILLRGSERCAALNPGDGALVWERACAGCGSLLLPEAERVVLFSRKKSTVSLKAVSVKDGRDVWSASVENYPEAKDLNIEAQAVGSTVLVVGPEVVAISSEEGKTLWRKPFPGNFGTSAAAIPLGRELYFTDGAAITRTDPASGEPLWRRDFPGKAAENLSPSLTGVLVLLREGEGDSARDAIQVLDHASGTPLWRHDLAQPAQSAMTIDEGRIYVTTATQLSGIDASNGALVFKAAIPPDLQGQRLLPDALRVTEDKVILAREIGVMAARRRDGTVLYAESVADGTPFSNDYTMHRLNRALESVTPLQKRAAFHEETLASVSNARYRAALDHQQAVNRFNMAQLQAQTAMQRVYPLVPDRSMFPPSRVQAAANWAYASLAAYGAAVDALMSSLRHERTEIMSAEVGQTLQSQSDSLQRDFYVRPRYQAQQGWSLVLVNLRTGKRAEIVLSPDNDPLSRCAANLPAFAVDSSGSRLVSKGLGLDPARFQPYEKRAFTPRRKRIYPHLEEWNIPYPSVLCFELASLPVGQKPTSAAPAPAAVALEKRKLNDQLIDAAFHCDLQTVRSTLDAGADVNAVDEYGQTALMLAAESLKVYKKKDIIAILLERGANPALKDPSGWTAADHSAIMGHFDTGGVQDSLDLLLAAQKEQ